MSNATVAADEGLGDAVAPRDAFRIALPNFEGPLDLLLHLIREHKVDILDIPMALITEKYIGHLEKMREINLDIAGEFLVMAATLLHLKSRMLLPQEDRPATAEMAAEAPEANDPRAELVRRLLEYQKYKQAAQQLSMNDLLGRSVFVRRVAVEPLPLDAEEIGLKEVSIYKLIEALDRVLEKLNPKNRHEVTRESLSMTAAMQRLVDRVRAAGEAVPFFTLFEGARKRSDIVITFLAMLEMCKLKVLRIFQAEGSEEIMISAQGDRLDAFNPQARDGSGPAEDLDREYR